MRTSLAATAVALTVLLGAPAAAAQPAGTGSAAVDSGSAAARSAVDLAQHGDLIGLLVLAAITPVQMLTGGLCDLAVGAGSANPCSPTRY